MTHPSRRTLYPFQSLDSSSKKCMDSKLPLLLIPTLPSTFKLIRSAAASPFLNEVIQDILPLMCSETAFSSSPHTPPTRILIDSRLLPSSPRRNFRAAFPDAWASHVLFPLSCSLLLQSKSGLN
ncbi:hypothetical protein NPIL_381721 [Nephila pilipes]|uniref:Uncharacterized protein n=1 Tax=Nephila pilipes TaxID=299642 RepID=A0A8X6P8J8_NEPPI|nr:hypothetical protein NPIL_381721 [Nephila pilipes]